MVISKDRVTPEFITELKDNEIFVFGSNIEGFHGGGAALIAYKKFGAEWGNGVGLQGRSYGIPTMGNGVESIEPYVDQFYKDATSRKDLKFLVTRIGCGIAGYTVKQIAPMFKKFIELDNVTLPVEFWSEYGCQLPTN